MSSGKTHAFVAKQKMFHFITGSAFMLSIGQTEAAFGFASGALAGFLVTPDADVDGITFEEGRWFKINRFLGMAWHLFWYPYGKLFRHRGLSHVFILGTLTRLIYVFIILSLFQLSLSLIEHSYLSVADLSFVWLMNTYPIFCITFFSAICMQDYLHIMFDICSTWLKRRRLLWYSNL